LVAAINNMAMLASPPGAQTPQPPLHDIADFKAMINDAGPINNTVKSFVENAQTKLNQSDMNMGQKLKDFDANDNVLSLIESIHESSMKSVSIQLTGKIGSKVSESFEQLVKQQ
jgi:hypothetical protein